MPEVLKSIKKLNKFFSKYEPLKKAVKADKDVYASLASILFNVPYEECLEEKDGVPFSEGHHRRCVAKSIASAMYTCYSKRSAVKSAFESLEHIPEELKFLLR